MFIDDVRVCARSDQSLDHRPGPTFLADRSKERRVGTRVRVRTGLKQQRDTNDRVVVEVCVRSVLVRSGGKRYRTVVVAEARVGSVVQQYPQQRPRNVCVACLSGVHERRRPIGRLSVYVSSATK